MKELPPTLPVDDARKGERKPVRQEKETRPHNENDQMEQIDNQKFFRGNPEAGTVK
jgi:hypothetical protein